MSYLFGSHVSCQGGILCGIDRAVDVGCRCLQIFVCQPRQWPSTKSCIPLAARSLSAARRSTTGVEGASGKKPSPKLVATPSATTTELGADELAHFQAALSQHQFPAPIAHASYLINLGSSAEDQWNKSIAALEIEWSRAESLQLAGLVMHPGACLQSTPEEGLENIARGIELVQDRIKPKHCRLLLENTAGQGSCLGWQFEQLGWLVKRLAMPKSIGICFDTCHAFAAGYDYSTPAKLKSMWQAFERHVGLETLLAIHLNDSQKGLGSRVDRHEHIGQGAIGEKALKLFIKSSAVKHLPMILETEKGINPATGIDYDIENLKVLRSYVE